MANIPRTHAKLINLGLFYGMGKRKLSEQLGLSWEESDALFNRYHSQVPFVRQLANYCAQRASEVGFIKTIGGRRCRFTMWEPDTKGYHKPMPFDQAMKEYGKHMGLKRAFTYKALNRLIQGSAADQTKMAMVALYKEGILPHIQVHDELDISIETQQQADKVAEIMEQCTPLAIPNKVDAEYGPSWGDAKTIFSEKPITRGLGYNHSVQLTNENLVGNVG
jgi:DNA polymerase I-like protein with 3'-5' exonuclease and polymerase domains